MLETLSQLSLHGVTFFKMFIHDWDVHRYSIRNGHSGPRGRTVYSNPSKFHAEGPLFMQYVRKFFPQNARTSTPKKLLAPRGRAPAPVPSGMFDVQAVAPEDDSEEGQDDYWSEEDMWAAPTACTDVWLRRVAWHDLHVRPALCAGIFQDGCVAWHDLHVRPALCSRIFQDGCVAWHDLHVRPALSAVVHPAASTV